MNSNKISQKADKEIKSVFILGYSQSGKSTRSRCINQHLATLKQEEDPPNIKIRLEDALSQSRHITSTKISFHPSRGGEIKILYLDYTGQDHQAAYYVLKEINRMIDSIRDEENVRMVFKKIVERASMIIEIFKYRHQEVDKGLDKETFRKIILDPFEPFRGVIKDEDIVQTYRDTINMILSVYKRSRIKIDNINEITKIIDSLFNDIRFDELVKKGVINESVLNEILCRIDSLKINEKKWDKRCSSHGDVIIRLGDEYFLRGVITGPLLAYLLLRLIIESYIVIILLPVNVKEWYNQLLKLYGLDNATVIEISSDLTRLASLDLEISSRIADFCSRLIDRYVIVNKYEVFSNNRTLFDHVKGTICNRICHRNIDELDEELSRLQKNMDGTLSKAIQDIWNYVKNNIEILWGEAVARIYHYRLISVLLSLYKKYREITKDNRSIKHIIFSLTYCEVDGKGRLEYLEAVKTILRPIGVWDRNKELKPIEIELDDILNILSRIEGVKIYFIPSTIEGFGDAVECTPFETLLIACLSGDEKYYEVVHSYSRQRKVVDCNILREETQYARVIERVEESSK